MLNYQIKILSIFVRSKKGIANKQIKQISQ